MLEVFHFSLDGPLLDLSRLALDDGRAEDIRRLERGYVYRGCQYLWLSEHLSFDQAN